MKAFLSRRPSTAPSLRGSQSDSSHLRSSHHQEDDGDFFYPASQSSSLTHGRSHSHAERGLLSSAGEASGSGSGSRAEHDIGSVPASRAPPSSWARNRSRFSLSRSDSVGSRRPVKTIRSGRDNTSGTTGARSGGYRLSQPTPGAALATGSSRDELNIQPLRRREISLKHNRAISERTTHPTVFLVTKAVADKEVKGTSHTHSAAATTIDTPIAQSFSDGGCTTLTVNSSRVTLLEALEQHHDVPPPSCATFASSKVSSVPAPLLPTADNARRRASPRRMATMDDVQREDASTATGVSLGGMLRGLRRKASLPILSRKPLVDEPVAEPLRQALTSTDFAPSSTSAPVDLASQLSELAISHGNGLLKDEEYRVLRRGLFELAQNDAEVSLATSAAATSFWQGARSALDAAQSKSRPVARPAAQRGILVERGDHDHMGAGLPSTSLRQRQGVSRPRSTGQNDVQQMISASLPSNSNRGRPHLKQSPSSIRSAASAASSIAPDRRSLHTDASQAPSRFGSLLRKDRSSRSGSASIASSQVSSKRRFRGPTKEEEEERMRELERIVQETRSVRSLKVTATSARKHDTLPSSAEERERALAGPGVPLVPVNSPSFLSMAVGLHEQDMLYAEKSSELIQAEIRILQAEGERVTKAFDVLESGVLKKGRKLLQRDASAGGQADAEFKLHWLRTGEWPSIADKPAAPARRRKPPSTPPSAFRRLDGPLVTPTPNKAICALSSTAQLPHSGRNTEHTTWEVSSQLKALRNELEIVESGKRDVVRRYDDRIAFLKSKERAAKIREGFA